MKRPAISKRGHAVPRSPASLCNISYYTTQRARAIYSLGDRPPPPSHHSPRPPRKRAWREAAAAAAAIAAEAECSRCAQFQATSKQASKQTQALLFLFVYRTLGVVERHIERYLSICSETSSPPTIISNYLLCAFFSP